MKKMNIIVLLTLIISFGIVGCDIQTAQNSADDFYGDDSTGVFYEDYCDNPSLLLVVSGKFVSPGYLWAELTQNGNSTQIGDGLSVDGGGINSVFLTIPLSGLNLNENQYSINYYYCLNQSDIGDVSKSKTRSLEAKRYIFTPEIINTVSQFPKDNNYQLSTSVDPDRQYCVNVYMTKSFTIKFSPDSTEMGILPGTNPDPSVTWSVEGIESNAGLITTNGEFTAYDTVLTTWYCYILATRMHNRTLVKDSVPIIINPTVSSNSNTACEPDNQQVQKHAGVHWKPGFDIIGVQADIDNKLGKLCTSDKTYDGFSLASITISKDTTIWNATDSININMIWAQSGNVKIKLKDFVGYFNVWYTEIYSNRHFRKWGFEDTQLYVDSTYHHKIELNPITGLFYCYINSTWVATLNDTTTFPVWMATSGDRVIFDGEILNSNDDMPGLLNDENNITNCELKYYNTASYTPTVFGQAINLLGWDLDDPSKWEVDTINGNSVKIWDVVPQQ